MKNLFTKCYPYLAVAMYVAIFLLKIFEIGQVTKILIPIFVVAVFARSFFNGSGVKLVNIGLFFVVIGDWMFNLIPYPIFQQLPVAVFVVTHICLIIFYLSLQKFTKRDLPYLIPFLIFDVAFYSFVFADITMSLMKIVLPLYLLLLSVMAWRATVLKFNANMQCEYKKILFGSLMFFLTDVSVFAQVIYPEQFLFVVSTWLL